jgi:hypothetical protein
MSNTTLPSAGQPFDNQAALNPPRLLDQVREAIRLRHYSIRTEQAYTDWIKRFILFHGKIKEYCKSGAIKTSLFDESLPFELPNKALNRTG